VFEHFAVKRSKGTVVLTSLRKANVFVRTTPNFIGIRVVLAVIVPIAYRADIVIAALD
jgi:hypothetical protein